MCCRSERFFELLALSDALVLTDSTSLRTHPTASRSSGELSDDDYDVLADGVVVGRIMRQRPRRRERRDFGRAAMAAFAKSWRPVLEE